MDLIEIAKRMEKDGLLQSTIDTILHAVFNNSKVLKLVSDWSKEQCRDKRAFIIRDIEDSIGDKYGNR